MGVILDCAGKIIWKTPTSIFERIYNNVVEKVTIEELVLSENVTRLIDKLYLGIGGFGTDIAKYLKTFQETIMFADLIKEAIEKMEKQFPDLSHETKISLWNFHKAILEYADTLH